MKLLIEMHTPSIPLIIRTVRDGCAQEKDPGGWWCAYCAKGYTSNFNFKKHQLTKKHMNNVKRPLNSLELPPLPPLGPELTELARKLTDELKERKVELELTRDLLGLPPSGLTRNEVARLRDALHNVKNVPPAPATDAAKTELRKLLGVSSISGKVP